MTNDKTAIMQKLFQRIVDDNRLGAIVTLYDTELIMKKIKFEQMPAERAVKEFYTASFVADMYGTLGNL